jgi:hypothetical protein
MNKNSSVHGAITVRHFDRTHANASDIYNEDEHESGVYRVAIYWDRDCAFIRAPSGQVRAVMWSHHEKAHAYISDTIADMA